MHADTVAGEQVGVRVLANSVEDIHGERLSIRLDSPMAAVDHPRFRPPGEASKASLDRVRLKSVIRIEKGYIPGTSEMKSYVARARKAAVALPKQLDLRKICEYRRRAHVRTIVDHDHLVCRTLLSDDARYSLMQKSGVIVGGEHHGDALVDFHDINGFIYFSFAGEAHATDSHSGALYS